LTHGKLEQRGALRQAKSCECNSDAGYQVK